MKLATLAYLPPKRITGATVFAANIARFKTTYPLLAYSESAADWPDAIRLKANPEDFKQATLPNGQPNRFAINNVLWLTALRIARSEGVSHMLYLEHDCRVGVDGWDGRMFEEFFSLGRPCIAGGTLACYNPANYSALAARRWAELIGQHNKEKRNLPIATYGWLGAATQGPSCVFPNGALAIYDVAWMGQLFDLDGGTAAIAREVTAFDMVLGVRIWDKFAEDAYEVLAHLSSAYSGYADILTSEEERLQMVRSGQVCAVHQVKSDATI